MYTTHEVRWTEMPGTGGPDASDRWVWRCSCGDWSRYDFDTATSAAHAAGRHLGEQTAAIPQAEVERLRGQLAKLEWAGQLYANVACCPVCEVTQGYDDEPNPHAPDCWLAAEIERLRAPEMPPEPGDPSRET